METTILSAYAITVVTNAVATAIAIKNGNLTPPADVKTNELPSANPILEEQPLL
ncbi:MAG: hypothetical protein PV340_01650 [Wolbachia sp.]|nr:hypothetical protein [Wolbachia sp.]MDD9336313.1 hypothetical protein [Wolbachia sp.]